MTQNHKNFLRKGLLVGLTSFGLMACSEGGLDSLEDTFGAKADNGLSKVVLADAASRIALCSRSIDAAWYTPSDKDTLSQSVDETFDANSFAVEAEAYLESENGYMTLASAGVDGDQDAWALRVENGKALFAWRDASTGNEWFQIMAEGVLTTNDTITVGAERIDSLTVLYVNGEVVAAATSGSTIDTLNGHFTIGFDPTSETLNMPGRVLMVRFGKVRYIEDKDESQPTEPIDTDAPDTLKTIIPESEDTLSGDTVVVEGVSSASASDEWIAAWEFNDASNVGRDFTGNGHNAFSGEGTVRVVDGAARFDGNSGLQVDLSSDLKINDFVIEARVKPTSFATMQNIVVAEPPGCCVDGWILRVNEGTLTFHIRDNYRDGGDWQIFDGEDLKLNEWNVIRVERSSDSIKIFQDSVLTVAAAYNGDVSQMSYDWGIGYDAMDQAYHNRYFKGDIDYIRFGALTSMSPGSIAEKSPFVLLADWEFNEPTFPGLDKIGNNSPKWVEGNAKIEDGALVLDGKSGIPLNLSSTFMRNDFAVVARIKPSTFDEMQNVFVAEPPGRYGDGWMIRVDDGVLTVQFRDESTHGIEWQVFKGKALKANQWTEISVIRNDGSVQVYQDGELTVDSTCGGDVSQLNYTIGIGYDAVYQANHDRFFNGQIDYIRYYGIRR